jgi:hypothetical protein
MRDGIYKNLPLSPGWRAVLRSCMLDAERGKIAREKVERAVWHEMQREIQPQFQRAVREKTKLTESLLPGFSAFGDVSGRDLAGQNSPLENEIIAQARRLEASGLKGVELEREAFVSAVKEYMERHKRQIELTILASASDQEAKTTRGAVQDVFKTAKIEPIVGAFLAGDSPDLPPARRPIDLDEDISGINP